MPSDSEILIKVSADLAQAASAFTSLVEQMGTMSEAITAVDEAAKASAGVSEGFAESWVTGVDESAAASVMWGQQMSQAFDAVKDAVGDVLTALPSMVGEAARVGDEMYSLGQRLNTSVENLAELSYIAEQSGVDMQSLAKTTQQLTVSLSDAGSKSAVAISKLGLSIDRLKQMDSTEAFTEIVSALQTQIPDASARSARAMEIFGQKFGQSTAILNEDIGALRENFKQLGGGMTTELAEASDRYGAALTDIKLKQDQFRDSIALAVLPALTDLLETFPKLGGGLLTFGQGLFDAADKFGPLLSNVALLKGTNILGWIKSVTLAIPGMTMVTNLFSLSVKGLMARLGPLALAIGAVVAIWQAWQGATAESGWLRDLSDGVEKLALRFWGMSEAEADAAIKAQHLAQKTKELADEQAALARTQKALAPFPAVASHATNELAKAVSKVNKEYADLLKSDSLPSVKDALDQNVLSMEQIAAMGGTTTEALKLLKESLDAAQKAADASPLNKFRDEMRKLHEQLTLAASAGAPASAMLEQFGTDAQKARTQALLIPGGLRAITDEILALAAAADLRDLNAMLEDFHKTTVKVAAAWQKDMRAAAQAWADFTGKQLTEAIVNISTIEQLLTRNQKVGLEKRLAQLEDAEEKEIDIAMRRLGVADELRTREINAVREKYNDFREFGTDVHRRRREGPRSSRPEDSARVAAHGHRRAGASERHGAAWNEGQADFTKAQLEEQKTRAENAEREAGTSSRHGKVHSGRRRTCSANWVILHAAR